MGERVKRVAILGSTGSVGTQTLDVVRSFPGELRAVALAAGRNDKLLQEQIREFRPRYVHSGNGLLPQSDGVTQVSDLEQLATLPEVDIVVVATVGFKQLFVLVIVLTEYSIRAGARGGIG